MATTGNPTRWYGLVSTLAERLEMAMQEYSQIRAATVNKLTAQEGRCGWGCLWRQARIGCIRLEVAILVSTSSQGTVQRG